MELSNKLPVNLFNPLIYLSVNLLRRFLWQTHPLDILLLILKKRYTTL